MRLPVLHSDSAYALLFCNKSKSILECIGRSVSTFELIYKRHRPASSTSSYPFFEHKKKNCFIKFTGCLKNYKLEPEYKKQ